MGYTGRSYPCSLVDPALMRANQDGARRAITARADPCARRDRTNHHDREQQQRRMMTVRRLHETLEPAAVDWVLMHAA